MINPVKKLVLAYSPKGDVTQYFAENPALYAHMGLAGHNGIDIVRPHGELMYAIEDCTVVSVKDDPAGFGKNIRMISKAKDENGNHRLWTYAHNSKNLVKQNDEVREGQGIALMGNTGFVVSGATPFWKHNPYAGTHLHLGLRLVKLPKRGGWSYPGSDIRLTVQNHGNGYLGSINPLPYLLKCNDLPALSLWRELAVTVVSLANVVINLHKRV